MAAAAWLSQAPLGRATPEPPGRATTGRSGLASAEPSLGQREPFTGASLAPEAFVQAVSLHAERIRQLGGRQITGRGIRPARLRDGRGPPIEGSRRVRSRDSGLLQGQQAGFHGGEAISQAGGITSRASSTG
jgi:hypothetical protein